MEIVEATTPPQELLSDLFHALNQPLTTLQCSLELALARQHTAQEYRESLQNALDQAQNVTWLSSGIRQLVGAASPIECQALALPPIELDHYVREAVEEWTPIAESFGHDLHISKLCRSSVLIEAQRLRQALFHCFEWILDLASIAGTITVELSRPENNFVLKITTSRNLTSTRNDSTRPGSESSVKAATTHAGELKHRLKIGLARAALKSGGGHLRIQKRGEWPSLEIRLPLLGLRETEMMKV